MFTSNTDIASILKFWWHAIVTTTLTPLGSPLWESLATLRAAGFLQSEVQDSYIGRTPSGQNVVHEGQGDLTKS